MKKIFSLLLVFLILAGTFINIPTAKAIDATELFNVITDGFSCDGTITYTVFLKQGVSFFGASIRFKYDSSVLEVLECEPYMTEDSYGDPVENISGFYESGNIVGANGVYGCMKKQLQPLKIRQKNILSIIMFVPLAVACALNI